MATQAISNGGTPPTYYDQASQFCEKGTRAIKAAAQRTFGFVADYAEYVKANRQDLAKYLGTACVLSVVGTGVVLVSGYACYAVSSALFSKIAARLITQVMTFFLFFNMVHVNGNLLDRIELNGR